jgi:hypothetical protein
MVGARMADWDPWTGRLQYSARVWLGGISAMRMITLVSLALLASPTLAQNGFYAGLGLGAFNYQDSRFVRVIPSRIPRFGGVSDTTLSYKLYGGFEVNDNLAIEISYGTTATLKGEGIAFDPPPLPGDFTYSIETEFTATVAKAVGRLPLGRSTLLGSIGYFHMDGDAFFETISGTGPAGGAVSFSEDGLIATVGVEWRLGGSNSRFRVRLEYEWWDISSADASTLGVGLTYRF